jgi:hypothetical protein
MTGNHVSVPPGPARQCTRCGALGTHYLTCPSLRLPPGYLITGGRPETRRPGPHGLAPSATALRPSADYITRCYYHREETDPCVPHGRERTLQPVGLQPGGESIMRDTWT